MIHAPRHPAPAWLAVALAAAPVAAQGAFTLPNGLRVLLAEDHDRPFLELRLELDWPRGEESPGREGALHVLARALQECGAGPYDAGALQRTLEERAIGCRAEETPAGFRWTLTCGSSQQEEAFALLAHLAVRPVLTGTLLESLRALLWRERQALGLAEWAELRFRQELVEGRAAGLASERSLSELGLVQLAALQRRVLRPERARLAIRGDLNGAQVRQLCTLHLGTWGPGPEPPLAPLTDAKPRPPAPACLATAAGTPAASLALLPPAEAGPDAAALLVELLPRWLQGLPEDLEKVSGRLLPLPGGGQAILLRAESAPGSDPLALLVSLRQWAARLGARTLAASDLARAERLCATRRALEGGLRPGAEAIPVKVEDLARLLRDWCAPARQRALLTGALAIPAGHPALDGLGAPEWVQGKD